MSCYTEPEGMEATGYQCITSDLILLQLIAYWLEKIEEGSGGGSGVEATWGTTTATLAASGAPATALPAVNVRRAIITASWGNNSDASTGYLSIGPTTGGNYVSRLYPGQPYLLEMPAGQYTDLSSWSIIGAHIGDAVVIDYV